MAISAFVPQIWAARFQDNLNKALVWGSVFSQDHQGEISGSGDTIKIPLWSQVISIGNYVPDSDISDAQTADGSTVDVDLDKQKYFNIQIDDVNRVQSRPDLMDKAMERSGQAMAEQIDADLRDSFSTVPDANAETVAGAFGSNGHAEKVIGAFANAKAKLSNAGHPSEGRWAICDAHTELLLDSYYGVDAGSFTPATNEESLRNGFAGQLFGFNLYRSGQGRTKDISGTDNTEIILGQGRQNTVLAVQIRSTEAYRPQGRFADAVKGLAVFGSKLIVPGQVYKIWHNQSAKI